VYQNTLFIIECVSRKETMIISILQHHITRDDPHLVVLGRAAAAALGGGGGGGGGGGRGVIRGTLAIHEDDALKAGPLGRLLLD
jgi:hypothetical protein